MKGDVVSLGDNVGSELAVIDHYVPQQLLLTMKSESSSLRDV